MNEKDRVRGPRRIRAFILNARSYGELTCVYCLDPITDKNMPPHVDHLVARTNGGHAKRMNNLVVSCNVCNTRKGSRTVAQAFGVEVDDRVKLHIRSRGTNTVMDSFVATDINVAAKSSLEKIELVHDWVQLGLAPVR
jgi:5-methylcytosine-specific restriction endonuclease McrA